MKPCCNHDCDEGRQCPTRRVRAGGPPPDELPIQYAEDEVPDFTNVTIFIVVVSIIFAIVAMACGHYV